MSELFQTRPLADLGAKTGAGTLSSPLLSIPILFPSLPCRHHYNIIFCWIPSHVCIQGNTEADKLALVTTISST